MRNYMKELRERRKAHRCGIHRAEVASKHDVKPISVLECQQNNVKPMLEYLEKSCKAHSEARHYDITLVDIKTNRKIHITQASTHCLEVLAGAGYEDVIQNGALI